MCALSAAREALYVAVTAVVVGLAAVGTADGAEGRRSRLLWQIETGGDNDRFAQIVPAQGRLLGLRAGVLYCFDGATGKELWRYPREGIAAHPSSRGFVLTVLGNEIITHLPRRKGRSRTGAAAIRLLDGALLREYEPEFRKKSVRVGREPLLEGLLAFSASDQYVGEREVAVFDLRKWKEAAQFDLPKCRPPKMIGGRLVGCTQRQGEPFKRLFAVDLAEGRMYSLPIRLSGARTDALPGGGILTSEGRISLDCAYEVPFPKPRDVAVVSGGVYCPDGRGLWRLDPRDGSELWRFYPGAWYRYQFRGNLAVGGGVVAYFENCLLYMLDAKTGRLRAAVAVLDKEDVGSRFSLPVACDGERAYVASSLGLKVYSTHAIDPETPDAEDPGDPAYLIKQCRKALLDGDFRRAVLALRGVGPLVRLRPRHRVEAAELLSQLSRSPAATRHAEIWTELMLRDGWIAGELFLDDYVRAASSHPHAISALLAVGGRNAISKAAGLTGKARGFQGCYRLTREAAKAYPEVTVRRPMPCHGLLTQPMSDEELALFRKDILADDLHKSDHNLRCLTPEQVLSLLGEGSERNSRIVEAVKAQIASRKKGRGDVEQIDILPPRGGEQEKTTKEVF